MVTLIVAFRRQRYPKKGDSKDLRQQIVETNRQIVETNRSLSQRIDETNKCIESRFAWLITIMVALTGILIAVIKL